MKSKENEKNRSRLGDLKKYFKTSLSGFRKKSITVDEALANPRKKSKLSKYLNNSVLLFLVALSLITLLGFGVYTGFVAYHEGQAGYIYQMDIKYMRYTTNWAGLYGASFGVGVTQPWAYNITPGSMTEANVFFTCFQQGIAHELYASNYTEAEIDMGSLEPATVDDVDNYLGINSSAFDSGFNTFTNTMSISVGARNITNIPSTFTKVGEGSNQTAFDIGVLKDGAGHLVFVAHIYPALIKGFNSRYYNFQMLLPVPENSSVVYNIWSDPNDFCVAGELNAAKIGFVNGTVTDISGNKLENVIIVVGSVSTITNAQGVYNLSPEVGEQRIIAIKDGYKVYESTINVSPDNVTEHNIMLELETPPNEHNDIGPDFNPNKDTSKSTDTSTSTAVGPGQAPPQVESPKVIEGQDYIITLDAINKKLRQNEFSQDMIIIQSIRASVMTVDFKILGNVSNLTQIDKKSLSIGPRSQGSVALTFFANMSPGVYTGVLNMSGGINAEIPITIEILSKDKIPVQALLITMSAPNKNLYAGSTFTFRTDLVNLLSDQAYPVKLFYTVQSLDGKDTLWSYTTNVFIKTSMSIVKNVELPSNLKEGDYIVRVTAEYLDLSSSSGYVFSVILPFYQYILFGKFRVWQAILSLFALVGIIIAIVILRNRLEEKKRYHLKVELSELPKQGPRSIWIGKIAESDHKAYMNLENFKTHTIVAGSTGGGKSFSAQVIIEEMLLKDVAVIVFDPTAQWTGMLRKLTNKGLMGLYPNFGMKPTDAKAFTGNIRQINNARELIDVKKYMKPGEIQIFAVHKLDPKDIDIFVANTVREVFHANFDESEPLRLVLVYDEVHRLMPKFGGSGEGFLQIERACREFRKWGIGVVLISQVLADFVGQIKANINTEVQMRTRDEGDLDRIKMKYGGEVLQSLVKASVGTGMVQNSAYNRGKPYFVTFRPIMHSVTRLSDDEIEQYNKFNEQITQIAYELEQLEEQKQDVFDLKMELKLALDKVKAGNFIMVQIYLEGLIPRVKKLWEKLGVQPKKLEMKVISEQALKEELEKAKIERIKFEATQKKPEEEAKKEETPQEKFKKDVSPDKILHLHNDMLVVNPKSLYSEIEAMKDSDFKFHVDGTKNDFAGWIRDAVKDDELADCIDEANTKEEIMKLLDLREKGQKLPKLEKKVVEKKEAETKIENEQTKDKSKDKPEEAQKLEKTEENNEQKKEVKKEERTEQELLAETKRAFDEFAKDPTKKNKWSIDALASPNQTFRLKTGVELKSLKDLLDSIDAIPDAVFEEHVSESRNDFANWTKNVFKQDELAESIKNAKNKKELKEVLSNFG